jgi:hypothetical protein
MRKSYFLILVVGFFTFLMANLAYGDTITVDDINALYLETLELSSSENPPPNLESDYEATLEEKLSEVAALIIEESKAGSESSREMWIQALRVMREAVERQQDNISEMTRIILLDFESEITSVPEPSTMLLLGSGLIGLWGFKRKFKK